MGKMRTKWLCLCAARVLRRRRVDSTDDIGSVWPEMITKFCAIYLRYPPNQVTKCAYVMANFLMKRTR